MARVRAGMDDQQTLDDLLDLERQGWRSLCEQTGDDFYGKVMTDDAVMVLANGQVMTRDDVVGALGQAPPWSSFDLSDVRLVRAGVDSAAIVYVGSATRETGGEPFVAAMTSVYTTVDGEWKLVLYQQTPVASGR
ncbi:MAG: nuclear transport factor 2 family protein [Ilumatobacteraceae bacterium]